MVLPEKIDIIKRIDGTTEKTIMLNPFLPENNALEDSPSQIFLKQCIYLFLLAQSRENFGTITTPTSQGVCDITKDVLKFIQENPEISQILEEKVLGYIKEVFGKIEELGKEIETISGQPLSGQTTAVSSKTPPLPVQPSCDDTTKSPGTPEQSEEDLKTLLKTKVEILNRFFERCQHIQDQLRHFSQSKTTEKPTEEVKPLPKSETPLPETPKDAKPTSESEQEFTNTTHSVPPTSIVAVAAAASATLATAAVGYANIIAILAAGQVKLEKMRKRIGITQRNIGKKSQASELAI